MVNVNSIVFTDQYGNASDFLYGNVGDLVTALYTFEVFWQAVDFPATITSNTIKIDCFGVRYTGFHAGDIVEVLGAGANDGPYVVAAVTSNILTITSTFTSPGTFSSVSVYGNTETAAFDFYYNLQGSNTVAFNSLSDSLSIQKMTASWANASPAGPINQSMTPVGPSLVWHEDYPVVVDFVGAGPSGPYSRQYTISHQFLIKPTWLSGQLKNYQDRLEGEINEPSYFTNGQTLQYGYQIDARFTAVNPFVSQSTGASTVPTNVGWFDELFNGGEPDYSVQSVSYSGSLGTVDFKNPTVVSLTLHSATGTVAGGQKLSVQLQWLPLISDRYTGQTYDYNTALLLDRAFMTVSGPSVNGERFGTTTQAITGASAFTSNANTMQVVFTVDFGTLSESVLQNAGAEDRYLSIVVSPEYDSTSRNAVLCDVTLSSTDTDEPNALSIVTAGTNDVHFFKYPDVLGTPYTDLKGFAAGFATATCTFDMEEGYELTSVQAQVYYQVFEATNGTTRQYPLDTWNVDTSTFFNGEWAGNIFIVEPTNPDLFYPVTDIYSTRSIVRNLGADVVGSPHSRYGYDLNYAFQIGYKWWQTQFPFAPEFNQYHTNYWPLYTQGSGGSANGQAHLGVASFPPRSSTYEILMDITWNVTNASTGNVTQFIRTCRVDAHDGLQYPPTSPDAVVTMVTEDAITGADFNGTVATDRQTKVTVTIEGANVAALPFAGFDAILCQMVLWYDDGTKQQFDHIASAWNSTVDPQLEQFEVSPTSVWLEAPLIEVEASPDILIFSSIIDLSGRNITGYRLMNTMEYVQSQNIFPPQLVLDAGLDDVLQFDPTVEDAGIDTTLELYPLVIDAGLDIV